MEKRMETAIEVDIRIREAQIGSYYFQKSYPQLGKFLNTHETESRLEPQEALPSTSLEPMSRKLKIPRLRLTGLLSRNLI